MFPFPDHLGLPAVTGGGISLTEAGIVAIYIEVERHGLDVIDAQGLCQRTDQRLEAAGKNDRSPAIGFQGRDHFRHARNDGVHILLCDLVRGGAVGADDLHAPAEDLADGNLAIHRLVSQVFDHLEDLRPTCAAEFVDALDGRKGGIAVEEDELSPAAGERLDLDDHAGLDEVVEFDDVVIGEADAAAARGRAEFLLLIGAVEVDVAVEAVRVLRLQAADADHPGEDEVLFTDVAALPLADRFARDEDGAGGHAVADLLRDDEASDRRAVAAWREADAFGRGGDDEFAFEVRAAIEAEALVIDGDFEAQVVHGGACRAIREFFPPRADASLKITAAGGSPRGVMVRPSGQVRLDSGDGSCRLRRKAARMTVSNKPPPPMPWPVNGLSGQIAVPLPSARRMAAGSSVEWEAVPLA